ncbi:CHRD domain-containing protein [Ottowia testudinis]|uniref:CHRD domain-containing protein n=1 Tax=Ottowia testudinis TaxID=2816950 RepID=A0A975CJ23_9BURK|nr:CHRD domain-containing protein [Ottowia testudinis]QTD46677.1 CHRD domain-containing protein [Ottowia testudinis]
MSTFVPLNSRASLGVLVAALLVSACATVDLGPRYEPPPVRVPQPLPPAQTPLPPIAQPQPVPPSQPVPLPLPPIGQTVPPPVVTPPDAKAHLVALTTRLDGASVMPPTRSPGTAQLDALYDSNTRVLRWKTSWSGLSGPITGVQFHGPADQGQNAPAVMVWPAPFGPTYEGRATLNGHQAIELMDGRWYVNVYTTAYPGGELRGQLRVVN